MADYAISSANLSAIESGLRAINNNLGTLNVNAKISGTGYINNGTTMSVASGKEIGKTVTVENDFNNLSGTITNAGTIRNLNNTMLRSTCGYVINTGIIGTEAQVAALANEPSKNAGRYHSFVWRPFPTLRRDYPLSIPSNPALSSVPSNQSNNFPCSAYTSPADRGNASRPKRGRYPRYRTRRAASGS